MTSGEIRKKFIDFFKKNGHAEVPSSSLIPTDPSVLFTSAGMQQFKPYYLNEKSPYSDKTVSVQKCFRTSDLDSIGDETHLSFFEMLGNFSFGDYFKEGAIKYAHEFITKELDLKIDYVSVFAGDPSINSGQVIPADEESKKIWERTDPNIKIIKAGREDNFWGPTGDEGPCGPTTEIYIDGIEIWNLVFNEYYRDKNGAYEKLKIPGVDTGMGLERLAMVVQNKKNIFETDLFAPIMEAVQNNRIIADHMRGTTFLAADGIEPSNTGRGYILRRLIRKAMLTHYKFIGTGLDADFYKKPVEEIIKLYGGQYKNLSENKEKIFQVIGGETERFSKTLEMGLREFEKMKPKKTATFLTKSFLTEYGLSGDVLFNLYSTYGFPIEMSLEEIKKLYQEYNYEVGHNITELSKDDENRILQQFHEALKKHQELSRTASEGMFKSGLAGHSEQEIKYHTATHLLMAALRKILGEHVFQKGSNINPERLRLDFSHPLKPTDEQKKRVEELVNEKINENLPVFMEETSVEEAKNKGALGVFEHKYGEKVSVYSIGPSTSSGSAFSREICAGPHVDKTGILGKFKITKEEAVSAGARRIKAVLE